MMPTGWTIGAELELADVERDTPLPGRSTWDRKDYTIVNSNGVANDPMGILWRYGGEVNTEPTASVAAQVEVIDAVLRAGRPAPAVNYRTNFHVHVHVPGLADDLAGVQRVLAYVARHGARAFALVDPLPAKPTRTAYPDAQALLGANARRRRRQVSHQTELTTVRLEAAFAARSVQDFRAAHARPDKRGRPQYQLAARCGVNLRALWEAPGATVEFRHFCMSLDLVELEAALRWCVVFLVAALGDQTPPDDLVWDGARFPTQPLYDHWLETRYRASSRRYHHPDHIRSVLARWAEDGTLALPNPMHREPLAEPAFGPLFE